MSNTISEGHEDETDMILVPRKATKEMIDAAWAAALAEDAEGVWESMINAWLLNGEKGELGER